MCMILLNVNITLSVSPEKRLERLAPFSASNPFPFEILFSKFSTFLGPEHCIIALSFDFSIHLNAVIPSLFPCSIPAWLAPVCEDKSVSHSLNVCDFESIKPLTVGIKSFSRASSRILCPSPSISTTINPGYFLDSLGLFLLASLMTDL